MFVYQRKDHCLCSELTSPHHDNYCFCVKKIASLNMRDLIRHYTMLLKRRRSEDSGTESQPLLSSHSSVASFGTGNVGTYDSETTDCETEIILIPPGGLSVAPQRTGIQRPYIWNELDSSVVDVCVHEKEKFPYISQFSHLNEILDISQKSLIQTKDYNNYTENEVPKTQSSLVTIFAIWNTIMGTSLLAMPWGMERAGLFPGIFVNIVIAALCLYTCYLILRINEDHGVIGHHNEVSELARILLGKWAEFIARVFSLIVLIGSNIVYWVLMSNFLYHTVRFFYGYVTSINNLPPNSTVLCLKRETSNITNVDITQSTLFDQIWDIYSTTPIILAILMFPLLNFKSPTFFTKFNSLGTLSVMYLLIFVAVKASTWGINMDSWVIEFNIKSTFCALSGMLSLSYFIHNIIISIMRSNRNPKKNTRDLSIAFLLVTFTYMFIGVIFYICFPLPKDCIEDNILNNFDKFDTMTIIARLLLLFQLFTVFPLISFMLRTDVLKNIKLYTNNLVYEFSYWRVIIVNFVIVTICILFACFLPKIGTLIRYTGALSGLVYIFFLPSLMKIASLMKKEKLTPIKFVAYILIVIFGFLNLISQFFIIDK
ncbi:hypothetical protein RI129_013136 [Pyrocoelia pectoralis]|uniref:Amino acid transporter transmembrane domain-containing protein n=1 Tax=Pyrocoelia pectoralis TaxID=417401 RepID=A0AAN7ZFN3_9COLE